MRARDKAVAQELAAGLAKAEAAGLAMPGISNSARRECLVEQMLESIRRVNYVTVIASRDISSRRLDPDDEMFDPIRAAILLERADNTDEAFWLVFLFVHFGRHGGGGWRYIREIYGRLGTGARWDWQAVSNNIDEFRNWLDEHADEIGGSQLPGGFGNHRKYESLAGLSPNGTGAVVASYVDWVAPPRTHRELFDEALREVHGDPRRAFDSLFRSMSHVRRFGRLARFDYLAMVGKLGFAPVRPGSAYVHLATGPQKGARLLFGSGLAGKALDQRLSELDTHLDVGMQVLEDSVCNWQKSPDEFRPFRS